MKFSMWVNVNNIAVIHKIYSPLRNNLTVSYISSPGAASLCARGHIFLLSNDTTGVTLTYINTHTTESISVTFEGCYLPPPSVCGERNGRCGMSSVFSADGNTLIAAVPLNVGIGLVSFQSIDGSFQFREKLFLSQKTNSDNCTLAFIVPYRHPQQLPQFIGYCVDLPNNRLCLEYVWITALENLNTSSLSSSESERQTQQPLECFDILSDTSLSNFLYFSNVPRDQCFFDDFGHLIFLRNSDILDHSHENRIFEDRRVNIPLCSMSEPRIQRLGRECRLAAYCNESAAVLDFSGGVTATYSTETDGQVFLCNSSHFVRFRNGTLTIESSDQIGSSLPFNVEETIAVGDCLIVEGQFYFIAALSDARLIFVNFTDLTNVSLTYSSDVTQTLPFTVKDQLLFLNTLTGTQVYNLTRLYRGGCLFSASNFDLVHSIVDKSITQQCRSTCDLAMATTEAPVDTTVTTDPSTLATDSESTLNPTTGITFNSLPPSMPAGLSPEVIGWLSTLTVVVFIIVIGLLTFIVYSIW